MCCFLQFQVKVDMGEPILKAFDVPTKLPPNKDQSVVKSELNADGISWNVTCVSMGNPHYVTFGTKEFQVLIFHMMEKIVIFVFVQIHSVEPYL